MGHWQRPVGRSSPQRRAQGGRLQHGGESWTQAHSLKQDSARHPRHWGWTLWEGRVKVGESGEVWSKAVDSSFNVQPESFVNIWNLRGMLSNAYSKMQAPAA